MSTFLENMMKLEAMGNLYFSSKPKLTEVKENFQKLELAPSKAKLTVNSRNGNQGRETKEIPNLKSIKQYVWSQCTSLNVTQIPYV
jgi:hypothetical protein